MSYYKLGHYAEALTDLCHAVELRQPYPWALGWQGITYRQLGQYNKALDSLASAITLNSEEDWWVYSRALTYFALDQTHLAKEDLSTAIHIAEKQHAVEPCHWRNKFNLVKYYLVVGATAEAEQLSQEILNVGVPKHFVRAAIKDIDEILHVFPDHDQAKALQATLVAYLEEVGTNDNE